MVEAGEVTVTVKGDLSELEDDLDEAQSMGEDLEDIEVSITGDASALQSEIDDTRDSLDNLTGDEYSVSVTADASEAQSQIDETQTAADALGGTQADVQVHASGAEEARSEIEGVSEAGSAAEFTLAPLKDLVIFTAAILAAKELAEALQEDIRLAAEVETLSGRAALKSGASTHAGIEQAAEQYKEFIADYSGATGKSKESIASALAIRGGYGIRGAPTAEEFAPYKNLATSTDSDLAAATELNIATQKRFDMSMSDSAHISDVYAASINNSNLSIGELAGSMETLGPLAKETGMPFETLMATLTTGSRESGLGLGQMTSALRMGQLALAGVDDIETKVNKKTGEMTVSGGAAAKALASMGLSARDVKNAPLLDTLERMQKATAGMSAQERMGVFRDVFGGRNAITMAAIAEQIEAIREYSGELQNANGTAETFASTISDNFDSSANKARESFSTLGETIGDGFLPAEQKMLDIGARLAQSLTTGLRTGDWSELKALGPEIGDMIGQSLMNLDQSVNWDGVGASLARGVDSAAGFASGLVGNLWDWFFKSETDITTRLEQVFGPSLKWIELSGSDTWHRLADAFAQPEALLISGFDSIKAAGVNGFNAIIEVIARLVGTIHANLIGAIDAAKSALGGLGSGAGSEGSSDTGGYYIRESDKRTLSPYRYSLLQPNEKSEYTYHAQTPTSYSEEMENIISSSGTNKVIIAQPIYANAGYHTSADLGLGLTGGLIEPGTFGTYDVSGGKNGEWIVSQKEHKEATEENTDALQKELNAYEKGYDSYENMQKTEPSWSPTYDVTNDPWYKAVESFKMATPAVRSMDEVLQSLTKDSENYWQTSAANWAAWHAKYDQVSGATEDALDKETASNTALGKSAEKASSVLANYDSSLNMLAGSSEKLSESMEGCDCALSDFAEAQEARTDLFLGGYIGPSGENYLGFLQQEAQRGAYHPTNIQVGFDYEEEGKAYMDQLAQDLQDDSKWSTTVKVDTTQATQDVDALQTDAEDQASMPITADGSQAFAVIAQIRADAAAGATMPIYSSGGGGGGGSDNVQDLFDDILSATWNIPSFAEGSYVSAPTLAVVGDRPGGEIVAGLDQLRGMFQPGSVTIDARVTVQGSITGVDFDTVLEARNEEILRQVGYLMNRTGK